MTRFAPMPHNLRTIGKPKNIKTISKCQTETPPILFPSRSDRAHRTRRVVLASKTTSALGQREGISRFALNKSAIVDGKSSSIEGYRPAQLRRHGACGRSHVPIYDRRSLALAFALALMSAARASNLRTRSASFCAFSASIGPEGFAAAFWAFRAAILRSALAKVV